jgi:ankyrin repeat protein
MRVPMGVCRVLALLFVLCGDAMGDEAAEAPPSVAKLTEKKFANEQYRAAILGKVSFRRGRKPLEPKEPLRLTFVRTDVKAAAVPIEVKDGEAFILQAVPGSYRVREIARAGRFYRTEQPFNVAAGNVVYVGLVDVALGDEDRSGYSYEYAIDTTVSMQAFQRSPELGKLIAAYAPPSLSQGENVSLFAPTYPLASGKVTEPKKLATAAENGDVATARELIQAGADLNAPDADGWAPLHSALRFGHREIAEALLDRGASLSVTNPDGWTPLMFALRYGPPELATRMIGKGAAPNAKAKDGWTPLMFAVRNDQAANARLLLGKGATVDDRTKSGMSALMLAAGYGPQDAVEALLEKRPDVDGRDDDGWSALMWALRYQRREAARRLVEEGSDIQAADKDGWTPLMVALRYEVPDVALLLLDRGARPNERNRSGWSPLHFALRYGGAQAARRLIESGAERDRPTSDGYTPLMLALRNGQGDNARLLVEKGVALDARNQDGWTALMFALRYGHSETAAALIQRGAAFSYTVADGWECLLTALRNGQAENARKLILKGANVKARTSQGWTALMFAIENDQPENAKLLLEKGADPSPANAEGATALSLAKKKGYFELVRLLGGEEAPPSAFAPRPAAPALPAAVAALVKVPSGTSVLSAGDCAPGLNGVVYCVVSFEVPTGRVEAWDTLLGTMKGAGWAFDKGAHAPTNDGTVPGATEWGFLGLKQKQADGLATATLTFPSGVPPAPGRTRVDLTFQRFPNELKNVTYSQVLATYPADAQKCGTFIDVTGVSPTGQWQTMGAVDYRKGQPQLQCLGTRVTLKVSAAVGGVQYDAGTMLTVDKDQRWIAVKSWE